MLTFYDVGMTWNDRLRKLVQEQGLTKAELSRKSKVPYDSVNKYLRGNTENPRGRTMEKLAKALGTTEVYLRTGLTDHKPVSSVQIPFRGVVAAGVWSEPDSYFETEEWLPFNPAPQFPEGSVYCLTVQGDSLDKLAPSGFVLVCVDLDQSGLSFRDGDLVIVERSKHQDGLLECTAKRVRAVAGGFELYPESNNPKWKPVMYPASNDDSGETIRVIARVEFIMRKP